MKSHTTSYQLPEYPKPGPISASLSLHVHAPKTHGTQPPMSAPGRLLAASEHQQIIAAVRTPVGAVDDVAVLRLPRNNGDSAVEENGLQYTVPSLPMGGFANPDFNCASTPV